MITVALTMWTSGNKPVDVYVDGTKDPSGYCIVTQLDPVN
jgi:hypothetical protein